MNDILDQSVGDPHGDATMTVGELRELLETYPDDLRVVVNGYEQGYDDVSPGQISVCAWHSMSEWEDWEGRHEEPDLIGADAGKPATIADALVLRRTSH